MPRTPCSRRGAWIAACAVTLLCGAAAVHRAQRGLRAGLDSLAAELSRALVVDAPSEFAREAGRRVGLVDRDLVRVRLEVGVRDEALARTRPDAVRVAEDRRWLTTGSAEARGGFVATTAVVPRDRAGSLTLLVRRGDEERAFGPVDGAAERVRLDWASGRPVGR